jgi:hypothetical protein
MPPQVDPDKYGQFTIRLSLRIGVSLFVTSLVLTGIHAVKKESRETLTFLVTALATSAGSASAVYALRSIKQSAATQELDRQQSKEAQLIDRTLPYIARWNDPQYWAARKTASEFNLLRKNQKINNEDQFFLDYLHQNPYAKQEFINLLNLLEEIAVCLQKGILKEDLLYDYYRGIILGFCETFSYLIKQRRQEANNEKLYRKLTDLSEKWRSNLVIGTSNP